MDNGWSYVALDHQIDLCLYERMSDEFLVNNDTPGSRDFVIPKEVYEIVIVIGDHIKWGKGYGKYALECLLRIVFLSDVLKK